MELRAFGDRHAHLPSIHSLFKNLRRVRLTIQVQTDVITEALDFKLFAIQVNVSVLTNVTGGIVHALAHQSGDVFIHERLHAKLFKIWLESDARPVLALLALGQLWFAFDTHIVTEDLSVSLLPRSIAGFYDELLGEDVRELGAVTVSPADNLLLVVVIVGRRQQVTEDQLWNVASFLFVHFNRNTVAIVVHANQPLLDVNVDSQLLHLRVAHLVVRRVDQNFIENLVQTRNERHLLVH